MRHVILAIVVYFTMTGMSQAAVQTKEISYKSGDTEMKGYLAYDDAIKGERPGILVVHEWWGHNDYARQRAKMLAELGYTAFALDMYGDGKQADHPKEAGQFAGEVAKNMPLAKARFEAAKDVLMQQSTVNKNHIAAIGYCFGGGIVLQMARLGEGLDGVVSFHGSLGTANPAQKGKVQAQVLVLNGDADPFVKAEDISAFKNEMANAGVHYQFIGYPNAKHAFTNPGATELGQKFSIPLAYNKEADEASWAEMKTFFNQLFK